VFNLSRRKEINIVGKHRSPRANLALGRVLSFIAGAINAGGFFIVAQYTSHMTGIISLAADNIALGDYINALFLLIYIACFIIGAASTTLITLTARKYHLHSQYGLPLILEAFLLLSILPIYKNGQEFHLLIPYIIGIFCFLMGVQNALITKASSAIIRTTHITGMTTDMGIEIGKFLFLRHQNGADYNKTKAWSHCSIIIMFFLGGIMGAFSFKYWGVCAVLPPAFMLIIIALPPILLDFYFYKRFYARKNHHKINS